MLPEWGTADRIAVNYAYSDVMRYITIVALAVSVPIMIFGLLLPDKRLGYVLALAAKTCWLTHFSNRDAHNAAEGTDVAGRPVEAPTEK